MLQRKPGQDLFTPDGKHLLAYAEKIITLHNEALLGINRPLLRGQVRLGITEDLVTLGLANVLGSYSRLYPQVKVRTVVEQSLVLERQLEADALDMIVVQLFKDQIQPEDQVVQEDELLWVKATDYNLPSDSEIPFIAFDQNCFYRQWAAKTFAGTGTRLEVVLECASNAGVVQAVLAGMGVALIAKRHLKPGMEQVLLPAPPNIVFVVRTPNRSQQAHVRVLQDSILQALQ